MAPSGHASGAAVIVVSVLFTSLAVISTALRLFTRLSLARNAGFDDAIIAVAAVLAVGLAACTCLEIRYGVGRHQWTISFQEELAFLKTLYASIAIYNLGLYVTKLAILFQYLRIFPQRGFRMACYGVIAATTIHANWAFWSSIFFCRPVSAYWDITITNAKCLDRESVWFANAAVNIVTDIAIAILPLPLINQLNIAKRPKIALMCVFALGGFTCIVSILRLEAIYAVSKNFNDQSYNNSLPAVWSLLELDTGILCSCLPTLKALVAKALPKTFGNRSYPVGSQNKHHTGVSHVERSLALDALGAPVHGMCVSRGSRNSIALDELGGSPKDIKVVTVVKQQVEPARDDSGRSENGSTRDLINKHSFSDL
ncbi:hypothetical protein BAUCODRAFT_63880 [Baudoinia panamericana UAMH 10762]|uniref:Rhodopsin domain-containing protein n=1 Tax=Baudoinia panamericana (strain UAMH 10762) TaxID=717646 RepID=M2MS91_BAUPA|nr:uncharacterized protein BAUCODRAFT_63880 [Baudoinia panamericana UAMH 10762]EMC99726.1 hypothetical protein BAUCODRAFT_63880 [Baudoinia panamericana UAMH 10762]